MIGEVTRSLQTQIGQRLRRQAELEHVSVTLAPPQEAGSGPAISLFLVQVQPVGGGATHLVGSPARPSRLVYLLTPISSDETEGLALLDLCLELVGLDVLSSPEEPDTQSWRVRPAEVPLGDLIGIWGDKGLRRASIALEVEVLLVGERHPADVIPLVTAQT